MVVDQIKRLSILFVLVSAFSMAGLAQEKSAMPKSELNAYPAYSLLDKLIKLPEHVTVHQLSSHNKQGLNSDENWALYQDEHGDNVIFDAAGPGCIRSMWATYLDSAGANIKFYFDGEKKPRFVMNYKDFYRGKYKEFPAPLISYETRGTCCVEEPRAGNSFIPIHFEKSLKISVDGLSRFFHIIYEKYPYKTPVKTFTGKEKFEVLQDCLKRFGEPPLKTDGLEVYDSMTEEIAPQETISLLKLENTNGIIRRIEIEADGSVDFFQNVRIKMRWDGHIRWDVVAPIGIFFGSAVEAEVMRSLPLSVKKLDNGRVILNCYFPMPFWQRADIELRNESHQYQGSLNVKIYVSNNSVKQNEGTYFTTLYHEGETVYGHDWLLFEGSGSGWLAGVVQSMQYGHYCEGDERFYIDGALSPQINGTGTEDYYLACFWSNVDFDTPFGCVVGDILKKGGGHWRGTYNVPSCYSRYHLEAPIPFYSSINARIQHGGLSNVKSNYRSLAFCYLNKQKRLSQTDFIDVGNSASEKTHGYQATNSGPVQNLSTYPEGEYFETLMDDKGRYHKPGEITFKIAIDPDNQGVRLRRRLDQKILRQKADVYIDGKFAGCWYHGYQNEHLRWYDSDFELHPDFSKGKSSLDVKLIIKSDDDKKSFTDFRYEVFSYSF
jgi:hypothetical protein